MKGLFLLNLEKRDSVLIVFILYESEMLVSIFIAITYSAILRAFSDETFWVISLKIKEYKPAVAKSIFLFTIV
jgi:hypothetical protein